MRSSMSVWPDCSRPGTPAASITILGAAIATGLAVGINITILNSKLDADSSTTALFAEAVGRALR